MGATSSVLDIGPWCLAAVAYREEEESAEDGKQGELTQRRARVKVGGEGAKLLEQADRTSTHGEGLLDIFPACVHTFESSLAFKTYTTANDIVTQPVTSTSSAERGIETPILLRSYLA